MTNLKYLELELSGVINTKVVEINQITVLIDDIQLEVGHIGLSIDKTKEHIKDTLQYYVLAGEDCEKYDKESDPIIKEELRKRAEDSSKQAGIETGVLIKEISEEIADPINKISQALIDHPVPQFAGIPPTFNYQFGMLTDSVQWTMGGVQSLNVQLKATENLLNADIRALTYKISEIADNTFALVYDFDFSLSTFLADASEFGNESEMFNQGMLIQCISIIFVVANIILTPAIGVFIFVYLKKRKIKIFNSNKKYTGVHTGK